jgi:hypothetical protein
MKKRLPPSEFVKKTTRFPAPLFQELEESRIRNGRTFNAEVVARLQVDEVTELRKEVAELKSLVREVLEHVRK